jgi:tetratricopeptide (TPR) repeat protein
METRGWLLTRLRWAWIAPVGLALLGVLVYANTFNFEIMHSWDDNRYLTENHLIRDFSPQGFARIFSEVYFAAYIPVTIASYAIEYNFWQLQPTGYHVVNVLLHAINGVLVYYFLARLLKNRTAALLAAVIWIVHPLQVETVAWISQRKNLLSMLFTLLALLAHMRSADEDAPRWALPVAWFTYFLAAFSKPAVVGVPIMFIIYDFFYMKKSIQQTALRNVIPLIIGAASAVSIVFAHEGGGGIKEYRGGSILVTMQLMLVVYWEYLLAIIAPVNLNNFYLYSLSILENPLNWLPGLLLLITMAALALWSFWRWLRGRVEPFTFYVVAWIVLFMLPVSNIIPIAIERTDRYMYFPTVVIFGAVGLLFVRLWTWAARDERLRYALSGVVAVIVVSLIYITIPRNMVWQTEAALWRDHLVDYPASNTGWLNLGVYYFNNDDFDTARPVFQRLIEINPRHFKGNRFLGSIAHNEGRFDEAVQYYQTAIDIDPDDPITYRFLAATYLRLGDNDAAIETLQTARQLAPDEGGIYADLGDAALRIADYEMARDALTRATELLPQNAKAASDLCAALTELGEFERAIASCQRAVQLQPQNGFYLGRLAHVLLIAGEPEQALPVAQQAVQVAPDLSLAYRVLGEAYEGTGDAANAIPAYERALELDSNNRRAIDGLSRLTGD